MSAHASITDFAFQAISARVKAMTGSNANLHDFTLPSGDTGLFGPDSITWTVHSNFVAMIVGGLSSLIVQSLNSRALSAVWDHSDFRNKLKDRLGRTTYFVAATTYGSKSMAMSAISRVNAIHANICGTDLQGNPYIANEPALIRWVHLAEVSSFLNAYQHLSKKPLSDSECDQYVKEMSQIGHLLGAVDLPLTWETTQEELVKHVSDLRFDSRAKEILRVVEGYPTDFFDKPFMFLSLKAAYDVMPLWVLQLIEKQPTCALQKQITKSALVVVSEPVQWMLGKQGVAAVAHKRVRASRSFNLVSDSLILNQA